MLEKGRRLEQDHNLEEEKSYCAFAPATQAAGAKIPIVAIVMRARFIVVTSLE
jgi:hypothetical protein